MTIKTKYKIGDKVYFYLEETNKYLWGNIIDITINAGHTTKILYSISNRFYDRSRYRSPMTAYGGEYRDYRTESMFIYSERELFKEPGALINLLRVKALDRIDQIEEVKKGFFQ